ncbi:hypothetical protein [Aquisphaera insulae]|uniref:hypothetical protein n=1 Tax=Aquisphaera insulae TaxID=2712864 RepID=UPI0013EC00FA|nr:hypothetical protein [Aquisphaera insulae]
MAGLVGPPVAVTTIGAALGFVCGWAPCHGVPFSFSGAYFGALVFVWFFGLPSAVLGVAIGAAFSHGLRGLSIGMMMAVVAALAVALGLTVPYLLPARGAELAPVVADP